jgi:transcriptional regulator with XRE-family HTH domain
MKISKYLSDDAILAEMGARLASLRLDLQLTQADLAEQAGVSKRTVERIETGASAQMSSMIRVLRQLDVLPNLDQMIPESLPRPMDLLKRKSKPRQRASPRSGKPSSDEPWTWDDDA